MSTTLDPKRRPTADRRWRDHLNKTDWVVYSKPPFGGSEKALGYLARYTHRTAFSSQRRVRVDVTRCPVCRVGHMVTVEILAPEPVELLWEVSRAPP